MDNRCHVITQVTIEWESGEPQVVKSGLNQDGRGMELSELMVFNNRLLTCGTT